MRVFVVASSLLCLILCGRAAAQDYDPTPPAQTNPAPPAAAESTSNVGKIWTSTAEPASEELSKQLEAELATHDGKAPGLMLNGVLTDRTGRTLYSFDGDKRGASTCYRICQQLWPPYLAGLDDEPVEGFTITERIDGGRQWVWKNKPLYYWAHDKKAGDVTGDKVNDVWHIVVE